MNKIWKDVVGYEGRYYISNNGELLSKMKSGKIKKLNGSISNNGYLQYTLNWKNKGLRNVYGSHVLVAMSFLNHIPNKQEGLVVDHIDGNKLNNDLSNLQLISNRENSIKNGCSSKYFGVSVFKGKIYGRIWHNKKYIHLGTFKNEYDAHLSVLEYIKTNNIKRTIKNG